MGWISEIFAHRAIAMATDGRSDAESHRIALYGSLAIDPAREVDPSRMIRDSRFFDLLEHIASRLEEGRSVGVRIGVSMRCDDYGAFGLAFKTAVDLLGSFRRVERFGAVVTSVANFRVVEGESTSLMAIIEEAEAPLGAAMTTEIALSAATSLCREVQGPEFVPMAVHFTHRAPADESDFARHFRCPVLFGASYSGLEIDSRALETPNRLGDTTISAFFDAHLDKALEALEPEADLSRDVKREIASSLSDGAPSLAVVSRRLGMSSRTLQRRLSGSGHAYQELVVEVRRGFAERLLKTTEYSLAEIAFLTGFAEQSTFTRAFKRWSGHTPAAYRHRD